MKTPHFTKEIILKAFVDFKNATGKHTYAAFFASTKIHQLAIERCFGSWNKLKEMAGLEVKPRKQRKDVMSKDLVIDMVNSNKITRYVKQHAIQYFGSLENAKAAKKENSN